MAQEQQVLRQFSVRGAVQGVGFRPFVFHLALRHGLQGWVMNTSSTVEIEVEGRRQAIREFSAALERETPPLARIVSIETQEHCPQGHVGFRIRESNSGSGYQLVSPDVATCPACLSEILDANNRRYHYPFANCTNCGPRFTIISDIPYDRSKTTMAKFGMCRRCRTEYEDANDRRFHAQPIACAVCGPQVWIEDNDGRRVACHDAIAETARVLRNGSICAVKGLGGFHLVCSAVDPVAVAMLRDRKHRPHKPFAVMMKDPETVISYCEISREEYDLLCSSSAPVLLLPLKPGTDIAPAVAPGTKYLGVMLPYTPVHHLLMRDGDIPLVMTSGNISDEPIVKDNEDARKRLSPLVDYMLLHDRDIHVRIDDSLFATTGGRLAPVRRARGYAPYPARLPFATKPVLAVGAQEKNTFCITRDRFGFISQHIGDLEYGDTLRLFEQTVELYERLFRIEPELIVRDLHPDYLSSRFALRFEGTIPITGVQHHHAHIAACMADNGLTEPVIGVAFDGSGFGPDGTVWGGEFLVAAYESCERVGHLEMMPLPGGDTCIRRPYRIALAYAHTLLGEVPDLPSLVCVGGEEREAILGQMAGRINTPFTSSCGRLFDAVSGLLNVCRVTTFEGQAAMALEAMAEDGDDLHAYPVDIKIAGGVGQVKLRALFQGLLADMVNGVPVSRISRKFHVTVASAITEMAAIVSERTRITDIVISGGCFQNRLLTDLTTRFLAKRGFKCFRHHQVPCNDGGISLGQAVIGHAMGAAGMKET